MEEGKGCEAAPVQNTNIVETREEHSLPPRSKKSSYTSSEMTPGYDPRRIPSTIFSDKPSTPTDWSAASSESLFSINAANYSFSVIKSGELNMINRSLTDQPSEKPVTPDQTITSPPVPQVVSQQDMDKNIVNNTVVDNKVACRNNGELSACISVQSSDSTRSFAFPVLGGQNGHGVSAKKAGLEEKQQQEKQQEEKPQQTTEQPPNQAWFAWLSCLSCCRAR